MRFEPRPRAAKAPMREAGSSMVITEDLADEIEAEEYCSPSDSEGFFRSLALADESVLLLDFDGTLAPFRIDPSAVRPWSGVTALLGEIQCAGRTRLAIVTGRPAADVAAQLSMQNPPEVWGLHGAERFYPDGRLEQEELSADKQALVDEAHAAIRGAQLGVRIEEKRNAVVVHLRGKSARSAEAIRSRALALLRPLANEPGAKLLQFDGGLELRVGRDKGDAVRTILDETSKRAPVAYLGDDATDEDAFAALGERGLGVLVRREWRPTAAPVWLRPPAQLREFLSSWLDATRRG
jgi:trehalose-phosphatase